MGEGRTGLRTIGVRSRSSFVEVLGAVLFAAAIAVTYLAAALRGGNADDTAALFAACGLVLVVARYVGLINKMIVPAVVAATAGAVALGSAGDIFSRAPLSGPFHYVNATGAFFAQAAIAGVIVAATADAGWWKIAGASSAVVFGLVVFASGAVGAALPLAVLLLLTAFARQQPSAARWVVTIMGLLLGATLVATMVLGATYTPRQREDAVDLVVDRSLSERRVILWHEALTMISNDPLNGVGPSRFQVESATAREDRDARWAHNEFLQFGAETGVGGFIALVGLFAWGFVRLRSRRAAGTVTVLGAAALAALGIHSCVDYVLHFPAIPLVAAALVGTAMASSRSALYSARGA